MTTAGAALTITTCPACSKPFTKDAEGEGRACYTCDCAPCSRCGETYLLTDPAGPTIAETDELAAEHDPGDAGACQPCWARKLAPGGKWDRQPCDERLGGALEGTSFPCDRDHGHKGRHGAGLGDARKEWPGARSRKPRAAGAPKRKAGHPPTGRTVPILVRLSPVAVEALNRAAAKTGDSRAAVVERLALQMGFMEASAPEAATGERCAEHGTLGCPFDDCRDRGDGNLAELHQALADQSGLPVCETHGAVLEAPNAAPGQRGQHEGCPGPWRSPAVKAITVQGHSVGCPCVACGLAKVGARDRREV